MLLQGASCSNSKPVARNINAEGENFGSEMGVSDCAELSCEAISKKTIIKRKDMGVEQADLETGWMTLWLGLFQIVVGAGSLYFLIHYCGMEDHCAAGAKLPPVSQSLIAVMCLGALGGCIHGLASLVSHRGQKSLCTPWRAFYLGRPFMGAAMAVMTYLVLVSGVMGFKADDELVVLAWSALAGVYSQPALDKLKEVFEAIFKVGGSSK